MSLVGEREGGKNKDLTRFRVELGGIKELLLSGFLLVAAREMFVVLVVIVFSVHRDLG